MFDALFVAIQIGLRHLGCGLAQYSAEQNHQDLTEVRRVVVDDEPIVITNG